MRQHYNVTPRFSPGSPAQVDEETARRVALQEVDCRQRALSGIYGAETAEKAKATGLSGIVYLWAERGKSVDVHDLITDEWRTFKTFDKFREWSQEQRQISDTYRH